MFPGSKPIQKAMTFKLVLVFAVLFLYSYFASAKIQSKSKQAGNIVKRYLNHESLPMKKNEALWHVFLPSLRCSGALVRKRWVITAASCFSQASQETQSSLRVTKIRRSDGFTALQIPLLVRIGNHHIDVLSPGEDMIPCLEVFIYPEFNENNLDGDIALLYLARAPLWSSTTNVNSHKLVISETSDFAKQLMVTGWGFKSGKKTPFSVLHSDNVSFISSDVCNHTSHYSGVVTSNMMCSERLACSVDGGSPLVVRHTNGQPTELVGVFSWGRSCALDRKEAVYAKIGGGMARWLRKLLSVQGKPLHALSIISWNNKIRVYYGICAP